MPNSIKSAPPPFHGVKYFERRAEIRVSRGHERNQRGLAPPFQFGEFFFYASHGSEDLFKVQRSR